MIEDPNLNTFFLHENRGLFKLPGKYRPIRPHMAAMFLVFLNITCWFLFFLCFRFIFGLLPCHFPLQRRHGETYCTCMLIIAFRCFMDQSALASPSLVSKRSSVVTWLYHRAIPGRLCTHPWHTNSYTFGMTPVSCDAYCTGCPRKYACQIHAYLYFSCSVNIEIIQEIYYTRGIYLWYYVW